MTRSSDNYNKKIQQGQTVPPRQRTSCITVKFKAAASCNTNPNYCVALCPYHTDTVVILGQNSVHLKYSQTHLKMAPPILQENKTPGKIFGINRDEAIEKSIKTNFTIHKSQDSKIKIIKMG
jgi:hypothetical protein